MGPTRTQQKSTLLMVLHNHARNTNKNIAFPHRRSAGADYLPPGTREHRCSNTTAVQTTIIYSCRPRRGYFPANPGFCPHKYEKERSPPPKPAKKKSSKSFIVAPPSTGEPAEPASLLLPGPPRPRLPDPRRPAGLQIPIPHVRRERVVLGQLVLKPRARLEA